METDQTPYKTIAAVAGVAAIAFFAGILLAGFNRTSQDIPDVDGLLWPNPPIVQEFSLYDQHGAEFLRDNLLGRWSLVFFGFTQCPDVCPTTLQTLHETHTLLTTDAIFAESGQVVFVSVDPDRDTAPLIRDYLAYFHPDFIGITGEIASLKKLTQPLGILFTKITSGESYTMDHSASILLIDPQGRVLGLFSMPHNATAISTAFKKISQFYVQQNG